MWLAMMLFINNIIANHIQGQGVGACGVVHGVRDKEVRNLPGNACAWIFVLGSDHTHAPAVVLPFEEDVSVEQG